MARKPDEGYYLFGAEALLYRLRALSQEVEGVRNSEDIECIHRMRVASRRLRSAFALFEDCLPRKSAREWQKQIRAVTRDLGAARDLDVQLAVLQQFATRLPEPRHRLGIDRLMLRLRQRREAQQARVVTTLDRLQAGSLTEEMGQALREVVVQARMRRTSDLSPYLYEDAYLVTSLRVEEMLAYEPYVHHPEHVAELHAMRIAAKRLRYTMEMFAPLFEDRLKAPLQTVRDIQELLGDIHDCDVWVQFLPRFLDEERRRTEEYFGHTRPLRRLAPGILALQQDRQAYREARYQEFVRFWETTRKQGTWEQLRQSLREQLARAQSLDNDSEESPAQDAIP